MKSLEKVIEAKLQAVNNLKSDLQKQELEIEELKKAIEVFKKYINKEEVKVSDDKPTTTPTPITPTHTKLKPFNDHIAELLKQSERIKDYWINTFTINIHTRRKDKQMALLDKLYLIANIKPKFSKNRVHKRINEFFEKECGVIA